MLFEFGDPFLEILVAVSSSGSLVRGFLVRFRKFGSSFERFRFFLRDSDSF